MKYKYRIITVISNSGKELFSAQFRPVWWPFWITLGDHVCEEWALEEIKTEKKKDAFKSKVVRLG